MKLPTLGPFSGLYSPNLACGHSSFSSLIHLIHEHNICNWMISKFENNTLLLKNMIFWLFSILFCLHHRKLNNSIFEGNDFKLLLFVKIHKKYTFLMVSVNLSYDVNTLRRRYEQSNLHSLFYLFRFCTV